MPKIGRALKDVLDAKGWTQDRLADATGIRRTDINRICNDRLSVGENRLQRITAALDISPIDLDVGDPKELAARSAALRDRVSALEAALVEVQRQLDELQRRQDGGQ